MGPNEAAGAANMQADRAGRQQRCDAVEPSQIPPTKGGKDHMAKKAKAAKKKGGKKR